VEVSIRSIRSRAGRGADGVGAGRMWSANVAGLEEVGGATAEEMDAVAGEFEGVDGEVAGEAGDEAVLRMETSMTGRMIS
jgi:hypothetical protein